MPRLAKIIFVPLVLSGLLLFTGFNPLYAKNFQGISIYYIRYDIKSSHHKITGGRLTMVPAEQDYRSENFSQVSVTDVIIAGPQDSYQTLENLAKKHTFIRLLEENGLKSVTTANLDTIISYEAVVQTPIDMQIGLYDENIGGYPYTAQANFAPISFPDQWESLQMKFKIKEILNDFILFFK